MGRRNKVENPLKYFKDKFVQLQRMELGEIPTNILNTMDILYEGKENRPLLIKDGVQPYSSGWHFVFTLNPGCDYKEVESKLSFFQSVVEGKVTMERKEKYLHIDVSNFKFEDSYSFSLLTDEELKKCKGMYLPMPLGIKKGGKLKFIDMLSFSHLLSAGVQNSGKSTWLRVLILFLKKFRPDVKIVYIDFMRLDAAPFKDIVYLGRNVSEAHMLLRLACMESDRRLDVLEKAKCFKASEYRGKESMNPILVAIDELSELDDLESQKMLNHLARTARKCGIHLAVSLQRPSHTTYKNFTDSRSQFPARLCFKMSERIDSEIVLGKGNFKAYDISGNTKGRAIWQYDKEEEIQSLHMNEKEMVSIINSLNKEEDVFYEQKQSLWLLPR